MKNTNKMKDYTKNIEPITDAEIEHIKANVRSSYENKNKSISKMIVISATLLGIVLFACTIYVLKWHFLTLVGALFIANIISLKLSKYAN
jgi:hypothetical protein